MIQPWGLASFKANVTKELFKKNDTAVGLCQLQNQLPCPYGAISVVTKFHRKPAPCDATFPKQTSVRISEKNCENQWHTQPARSDEWKAHLLKRHPVTGVRLHVSHTEATEDQGKSGQLGNCSTNKQLRARCVFQF